MNTDKITLKSQLKSRLKKNLCELENEIQLACKESGRDRSEVQLICVTKNQPLETLDALLELGYRHFGENRAQELSDKAKFFNPKFSNEIFWHFIGHLQTNKIKMILPWVAYLHSLDRLNLAQKLEAELNQRQQKLKCFIEVKTSPEKTKTGLSPNELEIMLKALSDHPHLECIGLMTMAPLTQDKPLIHQSFSILKKLQTQLIPLYPGLRSLSMGMSQDFRQAILEGATHIRVGSRIFAGI
jgi:pyridoxal phosphate enzyme (YggS family)